MLKIVLGFFFLGIILISFFIIIYLFEVCFYCKRSDVSPVSGASFLDLLFRIKNIKGSWSSNLKSPSCFPSLHSAVMKARFSETNTVLSFHLLHLYFLCNLCYWKYELKSKKRFFFYCFIYRIQEFKTALSEEKLDLKALRELCFGGNVSFKTCFCHNNNNNDNNDSDFPFSSQEFRSRVGFDLCAGRWAVSEVNITNS